jgi:hypothetical protein
VEIKNLTQIKSKIYFVFLKINIKIFGSMRYFIAGFVSVIPFGYSKNDITQFQREFLNNDWRLIGTIIKRNIGD